MMLGSLGKLRVWPIFLGQLVSLCITGTSSASSALWRQHHISIPFTQNTCMYFLLTLTFGSWCYYNNSNTSKPANGQSSAHKPIDEHLPLLPQQHMPTMILAKNQSQYKLLVFLFSVADVQANVLAVTAFRNTSVLSALIISSWTLPCIMVLSSLLLKTRYLLLHFIGVTVGLIGLAFLIMADIMTTDRNNDGSDDTSFPLTYSWLGDLICFISATLYAISNVAEEYLVHHFTSQEFLYRIGLTGMIQSGMLACYFEYDTWTSIDWSKHNVTLVIVYILCLFSMYSLIPTIYRLCGASFVNISMMTSNFYSLLIGLVFLNAKMPSFYPLSYFLVIMGAILYNLVLPPVYRTSQQSQQNQVQHTNQENQEILLYTRQRYDYSRQRMEHLIP